MFIKIIPVQFEGIKAEHDLQKVTSNDASIMVDVQEQRKCMANNDDGIVDDLKKIYVAIPKPINWFWILIPTNTINARISREFAQIRL